MAKINRLSEKIKNDVIKGSYGKSGDKFLSLRDFSRQTGISYTSAVKIYDELKKNCFIFLYGNTYYISTGQYANSAALYHKINFGHGKKKIGLFVRDISNPFFSNLTHELNLQLTGSDANLIIMSCNDTPKETKKILNEFISLGCSAVISFGSINDCELYPFYINYPLPCIVIGRQIPDLKIDSVTTDNYGSGIQAAKYLFNCGYKQFGYVGLKTSGETPDLRYQGFTAFLDKQGIELNPDLHFKLNTEEKVSLSYIGKILKTFSSAVPLGIFCYHDLLAIKMIDMCAHYNLNVPHSVGIIGYDDLPVSKIITPTLTTFGCNYKAFAHKIIEIIINKIRTLKVSNEQYTIETHLIARKSTVDFNMSPK